jgi:hypothetical protein
MNETDFSPVIEAVAFWVMVDAWRAIVWNAVAVMAICAGVGIVAFVAYRVSAVKKSERGHR